MPSSAKLMASSAAAIQSRLLGDDEQQAAGGAGAEEGDQGAAAADGLDAEGRQRVARHLRQGQQHQEAVAAHEAVAFASPAGPAAR